MLGSRSEESCASDASEERRTLPKSLKSVILPVIAGAVVNAAEKICYYPAVSAVALCCYSMVEPSVISAGNQSLMPYPPLESGAVRSAKFSLSIIMSLGS